MRTVLLAAIFVLMIAVSPTAAQGRGGGHFGGTGRVVAHSGHLGARASGGRFVAPRERLEGRAVRFHGPRRRIFIGGGIVDPFFWDPYPYSGYPLYYDTFPYVINPTAALRTDVLPKQTAVYIDGYYAGIAREFDGAFRRLHTTPGEHTITLKLDGYRTVSENIYVPPDFTYRLRETMQPLAAGEVSAPVPMAPLHHPNSMTPAPEAESGSE